MLKRSFFILLLISIPLAGIFGVSKKTAYNYEVKAPSKYFNKNAQISILCYHHIGLKKPTPYSVSMSQFKSQLELLRKSGFSFISLDQVEKFYFQHENIPTKSIVVTFDDGNYSVYSRANKYLQASKIPYTAFIYPLVIHEGHKKLAMNWENVKRLSAEGVDIGSHTYTHPFLTKPPHGTKSLQQYDKWLDYEINVSKKQIERFINKPVHYFATPFGAYNDVIYEALNDSNYLLAFNCNETNNNIYSDPLNLNRFIILSHDTPESILSKVNMGVLNIESSYPHNFAVINENKITLKFIIANKERYIKDSFNILIRNIVNQKLENKGNYLAKTITLKRKGIYLVKISALDKHGKEYAGNIMFNYNPTKQSFLFPTDQE